MRVKKLIYYLNWKRDGKVRLKGLRVDGKIISKWAIMEFDMRVSLGFIWHMIVTNGELL